MKDFPCRKPQSISQVSRSLASLHNFCNFGGIANSSCCLKNKSSWAIWRFLHTAASSCALFTLLLATLARAPRTMISHKIAGIIIRIAFIMHRRRWEIEILFGCLKTRGFRMEDTHITDPDKIEKLVFVLAITFC